MLAFVRKHPIGVGAAVTVVLAGVVWLAIGFFGVHTLFIDDEVAEELPTFDAAPAEQAPVDAVSASPPVEATAEQALDAVEPASETPTVTQEASGEPSDESVEVVAPADTAPAEAAPAAAPEIVTEYSGTFVSGDHPTSGTAIVLGNGTGQRFLRFEDFATDNGPDLNVYLVNSSTGDVSDFIDLGDLTGNIGEQNYEIPTGVDLDVYDQVVIWCVRFGVGFGDATISSV